MISLLSRDVLSEAVVNKMLRVVQDSMKGETVVPSAATFFGCAK